jgi:hypothetical protein
MLAAPFGHITHLLKLLVLLEYFEVGLADLKHFFVTGVAGFGLGVG